jgi:hypothetical protein
LGKIFETVRHSKHYNRNLGFGIEFAYKILLGLGYAKILTGRLAAFALVQTHYHGLARIYQGQ